MFRLQTIISVIALSLLSASAFAQEVPPTTTSLQKTAVPTKVEKKEKPVALNSPVYQRGPVSLGINWIFNFARNSNESPDTGDTVTSSNTFLRLEPQFEFYFTPEVPLTFSAGWLRRSINRTEDDTTSSNELLLLLGTAYHLPVTNSFSMYGAAGLGGYFGSSEIKTPKAGGGVINETTNTLGFGMNLGIGAGQRFSEHGQFRAGITYTGLFGSEEIESTGKSFAAQTHNVALNIALFYNF